MKSISYLVARDLAHGREVEVHTPLGLRYRVRKGRTSAPARAYVAIDPTTGEKYFYETFDALRSALNAS